jgi:hypothetical protein
VISTGARMIGVIAIAAAAALPVSVANQGFHAIPQPALPHGTAAITGVVKTDAGAPAAGAVLTLQEIDVERPRYASREVAADAQGRFRIDGVPELTLSLTATLEGFVEAELGQARPGLRGTPIRLAGGERLDVTLEVARGSSLSGDARDAHGIPIGNVGIYAFRLEPLDDTVEILGRGGSTTSDATGQWRIDHLPAGTYTVIGYRNRPASVDPPPLLPIGPAQSAVEWGGYFPKAVDADAAQRIELGDRDHRGGIAIELALVPVSAIEGVVQHPDGTPAAAVDVSALTGSQLGPLPRAVKTGPDGRFHITHVRAGRYLLDAFDPRTRLRARTSIEVDGKTPHQQKLTLGPAATVSGRLAYQPVAAPRQPPQANANIFLAAAAGGMLDDIRGVPSQTTTATEFTFSGVPPGQYSFRVSAGPDWWLDSAMANGRDAIDDPFEIAGSEAIVDVVLTLVDAQTEVSGLVTGRNGRPSSDHTVVLFPTDESRWPRSWQRVRAVRPDTHGKYLVTGLPAGEYFVALGPPDLFGRPSSRMLKQMSTTASRVVLRNAKPAIAPLAVR